MRLGLVRLLYVHHSSQYLVRQVWTAIMCCAWTRGIISFLVTLVAWFPSLPGMHDATVAWQIATRSVRTSTSFNRLRTATSKSLQVCISIHSINALRTAEAETVCMSNHRWDTDIWQARGSPLLCPRHYDKSITSWTCEQLQR